MTRIRVEDRDAKGDTSRLLRTAIESKVRRLRLSIDATEARLRALIPECHDAQAPPRGWSRRAAGREG